MLKEGQTQAHFSYNFYSASLSKSGMILSAGGDEHWTLIRFEFVSGRIWEHEEIDMFRYISSLALNQN